MAPPLGRLDRVSAELIADGGSAAAEAEFFRCREFLGAEGVTHSLALDDGRSRAVLPVIVRPIEGGDRIDATSPYGYPGAKLSGEPLDPSGIDWSACGLVSLFIRDRLHGPPCFREPTERSVVLVSDPGQKRKSRMSDRQQIRRNESAGYAIRSVPGPGATGEDVTALHETYTETMRTAGAGARYMFGREYFGAMLSAEASRLFVVDGPDGSAAAAAIAVRSDSAIHYYLSGTAEAHRRQSPSKNLIVAVTEYAEAEGLPMNLGGGMAPGDSLEQFKRGFGNTELPYRTHEIVCDPREYESLSPPGQPGGFFPAYRAG